MIETYRGMVHRSQLDHMGHMNVMWYTAKFDEATWHLLSRIGLTHHYIQENMCGMAAIEQKTSYKAEVMEGELIVIESTLSAIGNKTLSFQHCMYECETRKLSAVTDFVGVHLDRRVRKSLALPEFMRENAQRLMAEHPTLTP